MSTTLLQLAQDPEGQASRQAFEDAAWEIYLKRRAAGPLAGDVEEGTVPTREGCFWRRPDGAYGVTQWNAAWWGWRTALSRPARSSMATAGVPHV